MIFPRWVILTKEIELEEENTMWFLWVIAFVVFFLVLAQLISRLPGENFAGLRKVLPEAHVDESDEVITENTFERLTGDTLPYFENLLLLEEQSPEQLVASWKLDDRLYAAMLAEYHQENVDVTKAVLRLSYTGGRRIYEDYPVRLAEKKLEIIINAPGSTITAELGFYTAEHNFITMVKSNSVTIAQ